MEQPDAASIRAYPPLDQLQDLARERTRDLLARGRRITGTTALMEPELRFDLRGHSAGQVRIDASGRATIRYNSALLLRHGKDFLERTVPHEVAHYLAFLRHGRGIRPHGPEWQQLVTALGGTPERCHGYDVAGLDTRKTRRYPYHCQCGDHQLSSIRHNRIIRGARYLCRRCGEALKAGASTSSRSTTAPKRRP
ncbi:MAG: SprT-like domain-containing protein [Thiohalocapsa sp.]